MSNLRIGHGFDVHRFTKGRDLILGGVKIEYQLGLAGHSDADVLTHAIMDALLGAVGLGDIGVHFPPNDNKYKDADSIDLLKVIKEKYEAGGFKLVNIDAVIMAEEPKLTPYMSEMKILISKALEVSEDVINVKATTTETLGFTGRKEGVAASVVCLMARDE